VTISEHGALSQRKPIMYYDNEKQWESAIKQLVRKINGMFLPLIMVPDDLKIIRSNSDLPKLDDTHISLLKYNNKNMAVNSFEKFVIEKLKQ